jgi:hypothetical protein
MVVKNLMIFFLFNTRWLLSLAESGARCIQRVGIVQQFPFFVFFYELPVPPF